MNRLVSFVLGLLLGALSVSAWAADDRPNILLVMVDDMGYSDIGCYGGEVCTPTLDALAAGGVRFARFYNCAQCCPTRAALMSGLYPHQAGMGDMNEQGADNPLWKKVGSPAYLGFKREGIVTLPEALRLAGYQTFIAGKWHLGKAPECWPNARGFDRCFALIGGASEHFTGYRSWKKEGPISLFIETGENAADRSTSLSAFAPQKQLSRSESQHKKPFAERKATISAEQKGTVPARKVEKLPDPFYTSDTFTDHALRFIEQSDPARPWFGYLAFTAPHWPLQAHEADIAKYARTYDDGPAAFRQRRFERLKQLGLVPETAKLPDLDPEYVADVPASKRETWNRWMRIYAAMIDRVDQNLARIVELLKQRGQFDNTLILFLSDNGADTVHGPHWGQVNNTPFRKFKVSVHDGGIASPLIVHWPAGIPQQRHGTIIHEGAGHVIDIFPTCLDAGHTQHPDRLRGQPVLPLEGLSLLPAVRGEPSKLAQRALCWERAGNEAVRQGEWKLVRSFYQPKGEGQVANNEVARWGPWELYRVDIDPGETNDLSASEPERVRAMIKLHEAWSARVGVVPRDQIVALQKNH